MPEIIDILADGDQQQQPQGPQVLDVLADGDDISQMRGEGGAFDASQLPPPVQYSNQPPPEAVHAAAERERVEGLQNSDASRWQQIGSGLAQREKWKGQPLTPDEVAEAARYEAQAWESRNAYEQQRLQHEQQLVQQNPGFSPANAAASAYFGGGNSMYSAFNPEAGAEAQHIIAEQYPHDPDNIGNQLVGGAAGLAVDAPAFAFSMVPGGQALTGGYFASKMGLSNYGGVREQVAQQRALGHYVDPATEQAGAIASGVVGAAGGIAPNPFGIANAGKTGGYLRSLAGIEAMGVAQNYAENAVSRATYDPNRELTHGMEHAIVGGVPMALGGHAIGSFFHGRPGGGDSDAVRQEEGRQAPEVLNSGPSSPDELAARMAVFSQHRASLEQAGQPSPEGPPRGPVETEVGPGGGVEASGHIGSLPPALEQEQREKGVAHRLVGDDHPAISDNHLRVARRWEEITKTPAQLFAADDAHLPEGERKSSPGFYRDGAVWLNVDAADQWDQVYVPHEFVHHLSDVLPQVYRQLRRAVLRFMPEKFRKSKAWYYEGKEGSDLYAEQKTTTHVEEGVATLIQEMMGSRSAFSSFVRSAFSEDSSLGNRIAQAARRAFVSARAVFGSKYNKVARAYIKAIDAAVESSGGERPEGGDTRYAKRPTPEEREKFAPTFYSAAQRAIEQKFSGQAMPADALLAMLKNTPGVKAEELAAVGMDRWLSSQGKDLVSKESALGLMKNGERLFGEERYGGSPAGAEARERADQANRGARAAFEELRQGFLQEYPEADKYALGAVMDGIVFAHDDPEAEGVIEHSFPAGTNLRYLAEKWWEKAKASRAALRESDRHQTDEPARWKKYTTRGEANSFDYGELITTHDPKEGEFRSESHWRDIENPLVHGRFAEDETSDGRKVLLAEEIQSDWHQQGRDTGYADPSRVDRVRDAMYAAHERAGQLSRQVRELLPDDYLGFDDKTAAVRALMKNDDWRERWPDVSDDFASAVEKLREADGMRRRLVEEHDRLEKAPPDAPLKKTWHEYMTKRLMREAAERGADVFAWTTGDTQNKRYSLSSQVAKIVYGHGELTVFPYGNGGHPIKRPMEAEELSRWIGREAADRLLSQPDDDEGYKSLRDDNGTLEFAGEGMKGFYDRMVPAFVEKYVKKWGTKVEKTKLSNGTEVWAVPITDAMRKSVLHEGQPRFAKRKRAEFDEKEATDLHAKAAGKYGVTKDYARTGLVMRDGSMLDMARNSHDHVMHIDVAEHLTDHDNGASVDDMLDRTGAVRVDSEYGVVHFTRPLTDQQVRSVASGVESEASKARRPRPVLIEVDRGEGTSWVGAIAPEDVSAKKVAAKLREGSRYAAGEDVQVNGAAGRRPLSPDPRYSLRPNRKVQKQIGEYMEEQGREHDDRYEHAPVDEETGKRIADAYEAMKHSPQVGHVRRAYEEFKRETLDQYKFLTEQKGVKFEPWTKPGQPYADSDAMKADVAKGHLWYFPTINEHEPSFGAAGASLDPADNPLLERTGVVVNNYDQTYNDIFRAVHDYFGHGAGGYDFGPRGEENAWIAHSRMYSDLARRAMTTETRGQNSWVNFGPHIRRPDGSIPKAGEPDFVPLTQRPYAEQKVGLLPVWASEREGATPKAQEVVGDGGTRYSKRLDRREDESEQQWRLRLIAHGIDNPERYALMEEREREHRRNRVEPEVQQSESPDAGRVGSTRARVGEERPADDAGGSGRAGAADDEAARPQFHPDRIDLSGPDGRGLGFWHFSTTDKLKDSGILREFAGTAAAGEELPHYNRDRRTGKTLNPSSAAVHLYIPGAKAERQVLAASEYAYRLLPKSKMLRVGFEPMRALAERAKREGFHGGDALIYRVKQLMDEAGYEGMYDDRKEYMRAQLYRDVQPEEITAGPYKIQDIPKVFGFNAYREPLRFAKRKKSELENPAKFPKPKDPPDSLQREVKELYEKQNAAAEKRTEARGLLFGKLAEQAGVMNAPPSGWFSMHDEGHDQIKKFVDSLPNEGGSLEWPIGYAARRLLIDGFDPNEKDIAAFKTDERFAKLAEAFDAANKHSESEYKKWEEKRNELSNWSTKERYRVDREFSEGFVNNAPLRTHLYKLWNKVADRPGAFKYPLVENVGREASEIAEALSTDKIKLEGSERYDGSVVFKTEHGSIRLEQLEPHTTEEKEKEKDKEHTYYEEVERPKEDADGNIVHEPKLDKDGNVVRDEDGKVVYTDEPVMETVEKEKTKTKTKTYTTEVKVPVDGSEWGVDELEDGDYHIEAQSAGSDGKENGGGSLMYAAAFEWARANNARILSSSLTTINSYRRTNNMLSAALRAGGDTSFMVPSESQRVRWNPHGPDEFNVAQLAIRSMQQTFEKVPALADVVYDAEGDKFHLNTLDGEQVDKRWILDRVREVDPSFDKYGIGFTTAARAIITHTASQGLFDPSDVKTDGEIEPIDPTQGYLWEDGRPMQRKQETLKGILYAKRNLRDQVDEATGVKRKEEKLKYTVALRKVMDLRGKLNDLKDRLANTTTEARKLQGDLTREAVAGGLRDEFVKLMNENSPGAVRGRQHLVARAASIRTLGDLQDSIEMLEGELERHLHRSAVKDLKKLLGSFDVRKLAPQFKQKMIEVIGDVRTSDMSKGRRQRLQALVDYAEGNPLSMVPPDVLTDAKAALAKWNPANPKIKFASQMTTDELVALSRLVSNALHQNALYQKMRVGRMHASFDALRDRAASVLGLSRNAEDAGWVRRLLYRGMRRDAAGELERDPKKNIVGTYAESRLNSAALGTLLDRGKKGVFSRLLGEGPRDGGEQAYSLFYEGQDHLQQAVERATGKRWGSEALNNWSNERSVFEVEQPVEEKTAHGRRVVPRKRGIVLTRAQRIDLLGMIDDPETRPLLKRITLEGRSNGEAFAFDNKTAWRFLSTATPEEWAVMRAMKDWYGGKLMKAQNRVFVKLEGWERLTNRLYWPRRVNRKESPKELPQSFREQALKFLEDMGMYQDRRDHALPFVVGNAFEKFRDSTFKASAFAGQAENLHSAWSVIGDPAVARHLEEVYGTQVTDHLKEVLQAATLVNRTSNRSLVMRAADATLGNASKVLLAGPVTAMKQTSGFVALAAEYGPKAVAKALAKITRHPNLLKTSWEDMKQSGILRDRYDGASERFISVVYDDPRSGLGRQRFSDALKEMASTPVKLANPFAWVKLAREYALEPMQLFDYANAVVAYHAGLSQGLDTKAAAMRASEAISRTQNASTPIDYSPAQLAGKRDLYARMMSLFSSQNEAIYNSAAQQVIRARFGRQSIGRSAANLAFLGFSGILIDRAIRSLFDDERKLTDKQQQRQNVSTIVGTVNDLARVALGPGPSRLLTALLYAATHNDRGVQMTTTDPLMRTLIQTGEGLGDVYAGTLGSDGRSRGAERSDREKVVDGGEKLLTGLATLGGVPLGPQIIHRARTFIAPKKEKRRGGYAAALGASGSSMMVDAHAGRMLDDWDGPRVRLAAASP